MHKEYTVHFSKIALKDIAQVGGKNASLGEMYNKLNNLGISVPEGFAVTVEAYRSFLTYNQLEDKIAEQLTGLDLNDVIKLKQISLRIRAYIEQAEFPPALIEAIQQSYSTLLDSGSSNLSSEKSMSVAVRSSATAEDLPQASFAGQQESFLNVQGIEQVLLAVKRVFASLFTERAISYRQHQGFLHAEVGISVAVQKMVRSDLAVSGVTFTLDPESGFEDVILLTGTYGLGEALVQGIVEPDEFYISKRNLTLDNAIILQKKLGRKLHKHIYTDLTVSSPTSANVTLVKTNQQEQEVFCLSEEDIALLARQARLIEQHYAKPMDIEWAKDGLDGKIYIVQARPVTTVSNTNSKEEYIMQNPGELLISGRSVGKKIGCGKVKILKSIKEIDKLQQGDILVTDMTDPNWEPVMRKASAIITERGGRTCHAAIIARELGIPAVVGCKNACKVLQNDMLVTVSCAEGEQGRVYAGKADYVVKRVDLHQMPKLDCNILLNIGDPGLAFALANKPNDGVGLARLEFIINNMIGVHPKACLEQQLPEQLAQKLQGLTKAYGSPRNFFRQKLYEGVATIAAAFYPKQVIVRLSDFKSNEYANLLGGELFEPKEENPMLGLRGAARYLADEFKDCFLLECEALRMAVAQFDNIKLMVPFVRTLTEAEQVTELLHSQGLGRDKVKLYTMCELPTNALLAEEYLQYFDGFSIGSNDLTQLTLGLDRDSGALNDKFDERDLAVKKLLQLAIIACKKHNKYVGICGQGPSDHPELATWLVAQGIDSLSLNPDSVLETWLQLAEQEKVV